MRATSLILMDISENEPSFSLCGPHDIPLCVRDTGKNVAGSQMIFELIPTEIDFITTPTKTLREEGSPMSATTSSQILSADLVRLGARPANKEAAIREAAQMLVAAGRMDPAYVESMMRREAAADTFLGHGVAIPHGMIEDRAMVRQVGLAGLHRRRRAVERRPDGASSSPSPLSPTPTSTSWPSHPSAAGQGGARRPDCAADPREIVAALTDAPLASIPVAAPAVDLAERFDGSATIRAASTPVPPPAGSTPPAVPEPRCASAAATRRPTHAVSSPCSASVCARAIL